MNNIDCVSIKEVAEAIWSEMRVDEDRCDMSLYDMGPSCRAWDYALAAVCAIQVKLIKQTLTQ